MVKDLIDISQAIAHRADFVQGGGGNTSVKNPEGQMWIKSSGYALKDVLETEGYVELGYKKVLEHLKDADGNSEMVYNNLLKEVIVPTSPKGRPSMETGFHVLLDTCVIHSHSVYSNVYNCALEGEQSLKDLEEKLGDKIAIIDYYTPGYPLSVAIQQYLDGAAVRPSIYFLANHGLIVCADTADKAIRLHQKVDDAIHEMLQLETYPTVEIKEGADGNNVATSAFLQEQMTFWKIKAEDLQNNVLFPDQIVFFKDNIAFVDKDEVQNKVNIKKDFSQIVYNTTLKEATTIQETLLAYFYILKMIHHNGWTPQFIGQGKVHEISSLESEKFRKTLIK